VPVINATVSRSGGSVSALVYWNQAMIARPGKRDRFNIRLVSFGAAGASAASVLFSSSTSKRPAAIQHLKITLSRASAKILRRSSDVVLAVSQQYGRAGRHQNKFFRQYATVTQLKGLTAVRSAAPGAVLAGPASRAGRDCRTIEIRPGVDLSGCDLSRVNLSVCDLAGVNLTGADLSGAVLRQCNMGGAKLVAADLTGVVSGGIIGTPASLPEGWALINGVLTYTGPRPPPTHTVTFDANGGTGSMSAQAANVPTALTLNTFTHAGYSFNGWNTVAGGSGTAYADGASYPFDADATLYAQWTANTYAVTYDGNTATGGTVPVDPGSPNATDSSVTVLGNTGALVKAGFSFAGWNTAANGSGTAYGPGATFTMPPAAVTLFAQWSVLPNHTVTFNNNGGTGSMSNQVANVPTALSPSTFTRAGYSFTGWNTVAGGSGTAYADGATYPFTADTTLYAQWTPNTYAVTYDGSTATGGTPPVDPGSPHATDSSVTVLGNTGSLVKAGYSFANWNTAADGSGTAYAPADTFTMPAHTVTLFAQWTLTGCVVGATGPGGGTVFYNDTAGGKCYEYAPNGWNVATPSADPALVWALNTSACYASVAGAHGTAVGTGQPNTDAITLLCATAADAPAAWAAKNYGGGGLHDWFLPSLDELNQLCKYARGQSTAAADQATVCNGAGTLAPGFAVQFYWTSSQAPSPANFARGQSLGNGLQGTGYKDSNSIPVRPVRAF
jgi:uncharacterized repeat protein (TIGR02543 family)